MKKLTDLQIIIIICAPLMFIYILFSVCFGFNPILWPDDGPRPAFIMVEIFYTLFSVAIMAASRDIES